MKGTAGDDREIERASESTRVREKEREKERGAPRKQKREIKAQDRRRNK